MEIDKLIEQLKQGTFYYYKIGLFIKSPVKNVFIFDENSLSIAFSYGSLDIFLDTIESIKKPSRILNDFDWCYVIKNYYGEVIGYIGKEVE